MASEKGDQPVETVQEKLVRLETVLRTWALSEESDDETIQAMRERDFARTAEEFEGLIDQLNADEVGIELEAGDQPIDIIALEKGQDDFLAPRRRKAVEPGNSLALIRHRSLTPALSFRRDPSEKKLYVGEKVRKIELSELAKALGHGARLKIVLDEE